MKLFRVTEDDQIWLLKQPETAMGIQVVRLDRNLSDDFVFILGGEVAFHYRDLLENNPLNLSKYPWWLDKKTDDGQVGTDDLFLIWLKTLDVLPHSIKKLSIIPRVALTLFPISSLPQPPQPKTWTYGHLPFSGPTGAKEVYYRWEPWPTSRRISQSTGRVAPGTFTAPMSERQFMPTGFSAVARLALPALLPARYLWELHPPSGISIRCGAVVPMYGQSGGGVEVAFPSGFKNVRPIANPVVLPAL